MVRAHSKHTWFMHYCTTWLSLLWRPNASAPAAVLPWRFKFWLIYSRVKSQCYSTSGLLVCSLQCVWHWAEGYYNLHNLQVPSINKWQLKQTFWRMDSLPHQKLKALPFQAAPYKSCNYFAVVWKKNISSCLCMTEKPWVHLYLPRPFSLSDVLSSDSGRRRRERLLRELGSYSLASASAVWSDSEVSKILYGFRSGSFRTAGRTKKTNVFYKYTLKQRIHAYMHVYSSLKSVVFFLGGGGIRSVICSLR